ncbi:MAG: Ig-like domain-containing protein [Clostridia bacterium]|nr:Ig-like domain-containing protein [Clostridia bacterium]
MMKKIIALAFALAVITGIAVSSFAADDTSDIRMSADIEGGLEVGDTAQFEVALDGEGYPGVAWATSDPEIARINEDGVLNALKPGTVTVMATAEDGFSTSWEVRVRTRTETIVIAAVAVAVVAGAAAWFVWKKKR